jgi:hypothetical protein
LEANKQDNKVFVYYFNQKMAWLQHGRKLNSE